MSPAIGALIDAALKLPPEARGALASRLIESLHDDEAEPDAERAWEAEIARRAHELDSGQVQPMPWSEARAHILRDR